jgi:hypothetical protein
MNDRRDQYICAALTGLLANTDTEGAMQDIAADAVNLADALLAAAGGNDDPLHRGDMEYIMAQRDKAREGER